MILERGQAIDRFVVLALVGRGGMGEVYAAYDPELDRKVAIKLLRARGDAGSEGRARLLREAQAIAKLQHPNVVVVYDVGTFGESVFIAMEFVEGRTVAGWLHAGPRTRREILDVYLAAGRGLAAAHAAGLVHRDFKPDNVMVTNDGQVRVMDFGLARQAGERETAPAGAAPLPVAGDVGESFDPDATAQLGPAGAGDVKTASGKYLSLKLTQTGAMLGTPAYMAPEQFAVRPTDARTDQFSFCVALYEALYGKRPFAGETFLALMTSVTTSAVEPAPAKAGVPAWIRKVLLRGLATDPERRFPSMPALLGALQTDPTVRARRAAAAVALIGCVALALVGVRRAKSTDVAMCRGGDAHFAGVWEPRGRPSARKQAIAAAFTATGKRQSAQAFALASRWLDGYVDAWLSMYGEACEATHVRGEQSAEVLDLRMACLRERVVSVRAVTDVFAKADPDVVENAVAAAAGLPRLEACADVALLKAVVRPPQDEATRKRVEALGAERARIAALRDAGHCGDAARAADGLISEAKSLGYKPLLAEALLTAGSLVDKCIDVNLGVARYREAFSVALEAHHDQVATEAAIMTGDYLGDRGGQFEAGRGWLRIGEAMVRRIGGDPFFETLVTCAEQKILGVEGNVVAALEKARVCHALTIKVVRDDHPYFFGAGMNLGLALANAGHLEEALARDRETMAKAVAVFGADNPLEPMLAVNVGEVLHKMGKFGEARTSFMRAVDSWRRSGADAWFIAYGLTGQGLASLGEGDPGAAVEPLEEALRIRVDKKVDAEHLGETRFALARALWSRPQARGRALELGRAARSDYAQLKLAAPSPALAQIDVWLRTPSARL